MTKEMQFRIMKILNASSWCLSKYFNNFIHPLFRPSAPVCQSVLYVKIIQFLTEDVIIGQTDSLWHVNYKDIFRSLIFYFRQSSRSQIIKSVLGLVPQTPQYFLNRSYIFELFPLNELKLE